MKTLAMLALALAALYAALCLLVFATQRRQIYYPTVESHAAEADALRLPVQEAELKIWSIDRGGADALDQLAEWLQDGPPHARVDDVTMLHVDREPPTGFRTG